MKKNVYKYYWIIIVLLVWSSIVNAMGNAPSAKREYTEFVTKPDFNLSSIGVIRVKVSGPDSEIDHSLEAQNLIKLAIGELLNKGYFAVEYEKATTKEAFLLIFNRTPSTFKYTVPDYGTIYLPAQKGEILGKTMTVPIGQKEEQGTVYKVYAYLYSGSPPFEMVWQGYAADSRIETAATWSVGPKTEPVLDVYSRLIKAVTDGLPYRNIQSSEASTLTSTNE